MKREVENVGTEEDRTDEAMTEEDGKGPAAEDDRD